jgi:hypothetical protein
LNLATISGLSRDRLREYDVLPDAASV